MLSRQSEKGKAAVRAWTEWTKWTEGFPHVCGDGPGQKGRKGQKVFPHMGGDGPSTDWHGLARTDREFSPYVWGWSVSLPAPTRNRFASAGKRKRGGEHARSPNASRGSKRFCMGNLGALRAWEGCSHGAKRIPPLWRLVEVKRLEGIWQADRVGDL